MKLALSFVVVASQVLVSIAGCGTAKEAGAAGLGATVDPIGAARAKIEEAHKLLITQRPLDATRWARLLDEAHKLAPALDHRIATELRRCAILFVGNDYAHSTLALVDEAVQLDRGLAFDDTLVKICNLLQSMPPAMRETRAKRVVKHESSGKPTGVLVVSMPTPPDGTLRPLNSPQLSNVAINTKPDDWPKILNRILPQDPRGPTAPSATVTLSAQIDVDGRITSVQAESGPDELKTAAVDAAERSTYKPLQVFGHPVKSTVEIAVSFGGSR